MLEVTEHEVNSDYVTFRQAVAALGPGVQIAVDDAGAGFASLRHIVELRPQFVMAGSRITGRRSSASRRSWGDVEIKLVRRSIGDYLAVQPPSTSSVVPVMSEAAGEARKTTAPATSIGSPIRWTPAIRSMTSARNTGSAKAASVPGVRTKVGATALTLIPYVPHSTARHLVRCDTAALDAQ